MLTSLKMENSALDEQTKHPLRHRVMMQAFDQARVGALDQVKTQVWEAIHVWAYLQVWAPVWDQVLDQVYGPESS